MTAFETNLAEIIPMALDQPESKALVVQALSLQDQALAITVKSQVLYGRAMEVAALLQAMDKEIIAHYKPIKQGIDASKKVVLDREKADREPGQKALAYLKDQMEQFLAAERKRAEEQAARDQVKAVEAAERERQRLLNRAVKAEDKGLNDKAEELLAQAEDVYVAPVVVQAPQTATDNGHTQREVEVDVTDLTAFVYELVKRGMQPTMLAAQKGPLKAWVKSLNLADFPGLVIRRVEKVRVKAAH